MAEAQDQTPNRGPWIIAGAILLAAIIIVVAQVQFRSQDKQKECESLEAAWRNPLETDLVAFEEWRSLGCDG